MENGPTPDAGEGGVNFRQLAETYTPRPAHLDGLLLVGGRKLARGPKVSAILPKLSGEGVLLSAILPKVARRGGCKFWQSCQNLLSERSRSFGKMAEISTPARRRTGYTDGRDTRPDPDGGRPYRACDRCTPTSTATSPAHRDQTVTRTGEPAHPAPEMGYGRQRKSRSGTPRPTLGSGLEDTRSGKARKP
jgi:hypothetical protein